jgi:hypothetical protein
MISSRSLTNHDRTNPPPARSALVRAVRYPQIASISVGMHPVEQECMAKLHERFAPNEWQSKEAWKKEEALRRENEEASRRDREREAELRSEWEREEKQRRIEAVIKAVLITITSLIAIIVPAFCMSVFSCLVGRSLQASSQ